jgi:uncharacterized protein (TIGR02466 family)
MRAGVAAAPERAGLKLQLAKALFQTHQEAEIVDRLRPELADNNAIPELLYYLGRAALTIGDYQLASDALRSAAAKGATGAFGYLAEALARLDRVEEALAAARLGLERTPLGFASLRVVASVLRDRGQVERLWAVCADHRARGAWGGWLSAVMASAAAALGLEDELHDLVDPERWFSVRQLGVPAGFNQRLAAELLALHSTAKPESPKRRIDQLERVGGPSARELFARLRGAIEDYLAGRQALAHHPIIARRPRSVALRGWSLVARDGKYHDWHIHRAGWISGVYYVTAPAAEGINKRQPGVIEFGLRPVAGNDDKLRSYRWQVTPEPGMLLLFPSYYAHRTWPTGVAEPRISVAFDVRAAECAPDASPAAAPRDRGRR